MLKEFKEFAVKGNVVDLAVGVIIGAAFGKIVTSLVNDIIMPPIGLLTGGVNFSDLFVQLKGEAVATLAAAKEAGVPTLNYGNLIQTVIDFMIVAIAIFVMVKWINKLKKEPPKAEPNTRECPFCTTQIPKKASRCPSCTSQVEPVKA